jgi:hypothetical protein
MQSSKSQIKSVALIPIISIRKTFCKDVQRFRSLLSLKVGKHNCSKSEIGITRWQSQAVKFQTFGIGKTTITVIFHFPVWRFASVLNCLVMVCSYDPLDLFLQ